MVAKHSALGLLADALDRLYAAPLDGFVALRRELAAGLRAAGDVAASAEVAAAKKPSRTAWALNQVARRRPELLRAAFDAHGAAAKAQSHGDAESMRETVRGFRDALGDVAKESGQIAADAGVPLSATQVRQLGETVRAAIGGASRDLLLAGRLSEDSDVEDPFAGLDAAPGRGGPRRTPTPGPPVENAATKAREREAQRAREAAERAAEEARARIQALEQEARDARAAVREAEIAARRAEAEADRARRAAADAEERLSKARARANERA
jgi:hypothetical protein